MGICNEGGSAVGMRPDWGHGPNQPKLTFTEEEIRKVAAEHHETGPDQGERGGLCLCRYYRPHAVEYSIDHFIEMLKENRYGNQASVDPNSA